MQLEAQTILAKLEQLIATYHVNHVLFAGAGPPRDAAAELNSQPWLRFTLVLDGESKIRLCRNGIMFTERLTPEQAICMPPFAPEKVEYLSKESLAMVLRPNYLRLVYAQGDQVGTTPKIRCSYHLEDTLGKGTILAIKALNEMEDNPATAASMIEVIMKMIYHDLALSSGRRDGRAETLWRQMADYTEDNCLNRISRTDVAQHFRVTPEYVSQLFKQYGHEGFCTFANRKRLELASMMLTGEQQTTIKEIAWRCGFSHTSYFIKAFSECYGMSPGVYRNKPASSTNFLSDE